MDEQMGYLIVVLLNEAALRGSFLGGWAGPLLHFYPRPMGHIERTDDRQKDRQRDRRKGVINEYTGSVD